MTNIKFYLVSYDRCDHRAVSKLMPKERERIVCYAVNGSVPKIIGAKIKVINEWQLKWHSPRYQTLKYYEYGLIPHCVKNTELLEGLTHVGMLHNDVLFAENSVNNMIKDLDENPRQIFYIILRQNDVLYFTKNQLKHIAEYLSLKLDVNVDPEYIWNNGFISESLTVTPIDIFTKFGEFMIKYQYDFEDMLNTNRWGLMSTVKHRLCGLTERFWGMYLMSCGLPIRKMDVEHDREFYEHAHLKFK
jgi:hypothetical protein